MIDPSCSGSMLNDVDQYTTSRLQFKVSRNCRWFVHSLGIFYFARIFFFFFPFPSTLLSRASLEHSLRSHVNWVAVSGNALVINYPRCRLYTVMTLRGRHAREDGERLSVKPGCNALPLSCNGIGGEQDPLFARVSHLPSTSIGSIARWQRKISARFIAPRCYSWFHLGGCKFLFDFIEVEEERTESETINSLIKRDNMELS